MPRPSLGQLEAGIVAGDRAMLARGVTLVESRREDDAELAEELLEKLMPRTGRAARVGLSGVPGAGKSTLLENLGMRLIDRGLRVAVLAIDPTSLSSGGSILGDKTRMPRLATTRDAYVRPSPSASTPGGVARRTREAMVLCEAAGFDVVIVETVGVGQGEVAVVDMVDTFVAVLIAGAGDDLQGIKKGILEQVDVVAINKADGDGVVRAKLAARELGAAMHFQAARPSGFAPKALAVSALEGTGLDELWGLVEAHRAALEKSGELERVRATQQAKWMWSLVDEQVLSSVRAQVRASAGLTQLERDVVAGVAWAPRAARAIVGSLG
jgi:LAO/AO transport system kinase